MFMSKEELQNLDPQRKVRISIFNAESETTDTFEARLLVTRTPDPKKFIAIPMSLDGRPSGTHYEWDLDASNPYMFPAIGDLPTYLTVLDYAEPQVLKDLPDMDEDDIEHLRGHFDSLSIIGQLYFKGMVDQFSKDDLMKMIVDYIDQQIGE